MKIIIQKQAPIQKNNIPEYTEFCALCKLKNQKTLPKVDNNLKAFMTKGMNDHELNCNQIEVNLRNGERRNYKV